MIQRLKMKDRINNLLFMFGFAKRMSDDCCCFRCKNMATCNNTKNFITFLDFANHKCVDKFEIDENFNNNFNTLKSIYEKSCT